MFKAKCSGRLTTQYKIEYRIRYCQSTWQWNNLFSIIEVALSLESCLWHVKNTGFQISGCMLDMHVDLFWLKIRDMSQLLDLYPECFSVYLLIMTFVWWILRHSQSVCSLTCLAELRGTPAASRWQDGNNSLTEAWTTLLDPAPQAPKCCVRLASIGMLHAVDLTTHTSALHHVTAGCTHGPANHYHLQN